MTNKYEKYTKSELIKLMVQRDTERKLGLVWERKEIEHDRTLNDDFVTMELDRDFSVGEVPHRNLIIEGDNFDALRYLKMIYKGRIKCACIDPPYNTENKDFIYNDKYVDAEDRFRQSKWLEHLYQRLIIAKDLLTPDGIMLVFINDENCAKMDMLLEQIMPGRRLGSFVWRTKDTGNDRGGNLSQVHEHILVYANPGFEFRGKPINITQYRNSEEDPRGPSRPQPITKAHSYKERPNTYYPIQDSKTGYWYPCDPDRVWAYSTKSRVKEGQQLRSETIEELIEKKEIYFPACDPKDVMLWNTKEELLNAIRQGKGPVLPQKKTPLLREDLPDLDFWVGKPISPGRPSRKHYLKEKKKLTAPLTSWIAGMNEEVDFEDIAFQDEVMVIRSPRGREGSDAIKAIMESKAFDYPKPPTLIKQLIDQSTKKDDIVLDFYAGSGTTGYSTLQLNKEDGGNRRFILVSATEATEDEPDKNVCRDVCAIRLKRSIEGYGKHKPLGGGFAYMTAVRTPMKSLYDVVRHDQVWYVLQQIHTEGLSPFLETEAMQTCETDSIRLAYLPETNDTVLIRLKKMLETNAKPTIAYTWRPAVLKQQLLQEHLSIERIPEFLVERFGRGAE